MRCPPSGLGRRTEGSPRRTSGSRGGDHVSRHCRGAVPAGCGYRSSVLSRRAGGPFRTELPALHRPFRSVRPYPLCTPFSAPRDPSPLCAVFSCFARSFPASRGPFPASRGPSRFRSGCSAGMPCSPGPAPQTDGCRVAEPLGIFWPLRHVAARRNICRFEGIYYLCSQFIKIRLRLWQI